MRFETSWPCRNCLAKLHFKLGTKPKPIQPIIVQIHCSCGVDWMLKVTRKGKSPSGQLAINIEAISHNMPKKPKGFVNRYEGLKVGSPC